jgi:uncharacterized membrane protein (UPF0127 family)
MTGTCSWRAAASVLMLLSAAIAHAAEPEGLLDGFSRGRGMIETDHACHLLDIYLAVTPGQRAQGLMYIRELGEYEGMLFPTRQAAVVNMWMKNTYIPLDMLFIRGDGKIVGITANTTPLSETTVSSKQPVTSVLELNGGFAARHGVAAGDRFVLLD